MPKTVRESVPDLGIKVTAAGHGRSHQHPRMLSSALVLPFPLPADFVLNPLARLRLDYSARPPSHTER